jgi:hypothetical protein
MPVLALRRDENRRYLDAAYMPASRVRRRTAQAQSQTPRRNAGPSPSPSPVCVLTGEEARCGDGLLVRRRRGLLRGAVAAQQAHDCADRCGDDHKCEGVLTSGTIKSTPCVVTLMREDTLPLD